MPEFFIPNIDDRDYAEKLWQGIKTFMTETDEALSRVTAAPEA
jgi:hypothetical protein